MKYWDQDDLWNGKYTIADFFDILDAILEEEERKMKIDAALHGLQL